MNHASFLMMVALVMVSRGFEFWIAVSLNNIMGIRNEERRMVEHNPHSRSVQIGEGIKVAVSRTRDTKFQR